MKGGPDFLRSCPKSINSSFIEKARFSKLPHKSPNILDIFVRKFVTLNFQKLAYLVTLVRDFLTHSQEIVKGL